MMDVMQDMAGRLGLGLRQLGAAAAHTKLDPWVANFMKILCSQEPYRNAPMEMGHDSPDLPMGMLTILHLERCKELLEKFTDMLKSKEGDPKIEAAAASFETIRDTRAASHLIGDMTGPTLDDPLYDRYEKLECTIEPLDKGSDDYKMIHKYLETTYEPFKIGEISYGASIDHIFMVESGPGPSYNEVVKLPHKHLDWTFWESHYCSDAAADAARYGFAAVDRPDGFLVLAVMWCGIELHDTATLEEKKVGVKGVGKKKTEESQHFVWKDDIKVPCGRLVPTEKNISMLEYNEYAVYDPRQVCMELGLKRLLF
ncbi:Poly [ADP-ribose] polymerase 3 [Dionaea muscipula]